jgi:hypothetical protein
VVFYDFGLPFRLEVLNLPLKKLDLLLCGHKLGGLTFKALAH